MAREQNDPIRVRLEIEIPQGGGAIAKAVRPTAVLPNIDQPLAYVQTMARWDDETDLYYICSFGTALGAHYVFAQVYATAGAQNGPPPPGCPWTQPDPITGDWEFSDTTAQELAVIDVDITNYLVVWADDGSGPQGLLRPFIPYDAGQTYCQAYGSGSQGPALVGEKLAGVSGKWASMARTWRFSLHGAADLGCTQCALLNGTWALRFDDACPEQCRWYQRLPRGLFGAEGGSVWRLQYCGQDEHWYLDCVTNLDQAVGTMISYRCHESAWKTRGSNTLVLHTDSGLCRVPDKLTLTSA